MTPLLQFAHRNAIKSTPNDLHSILKNEYNYNHMNLFIDPIGAIFTLIIIIFSSMFHEIAHAYTADRLGDHTAKVLGRISLNPLRHIDFFMTIVLPLLVGFGAAKPVPVDFFNLKEGRKDLALVSLAGPLTNFILAILCSLIAHLLSSFGDTELITTIYYILRFIASVNVTLAIFNLFPIPPLDGSKVFTMLLPEKEAYAYMGNNQLGTMILVFLLFVPLGPFSLTQLITSLSSSIFTLLAF